MPRASRAALLAFWLLAWLTPYELALLWRQGAAEVELRTRGTDMPVESLMLLEPDGSPAQLRLAAIWRF